MLYNVEPITRRKLDLTRKDGGTQERLLRIIAENPGKRAEQLSQIYYKEYNSATSINRHLTQMRKAGAIIVKEVRVPELNNRLISTFWRAP